LLPAIGSLAPGQTSTFWELLQSNFFTQRWLLTSFPRNTLLLLSLTTILPVFLLSIRWSSQFGDPSRVGVLITTATYHLCHAVILLACLWMVLDPGFSPRKIATTLPFPGNSLTFLPLYYLAALSIGYYSGYLLLISRAVPTRGGRPSPAIAWTERAVVAAIFILLLTVPTVLIHRNLPQIRLTNGLLQTQFAADLATDLPEKGLILSDEPRRLWVLQEWLTNQKRAQNYLFICTSWLQLPQYQKYLTRKSPQWTPPPIANEKALIAPDLLLQSMEKNGKDKPVTYLHPSFGYYFESFHSEPNGLGSKLTFDQSNALLPPPLPPEVIQHNDKFWAAAQAGIMKILLPAVAEPAENLKLPFPQNLYQRIGLNPEQNVQAKLLAHFYSRSLVKWGVELQRLSNYEGAAEKFKLARKLNPKNVVAEINLAFNKKFRRGEPVGLEVDKKLDDIFGESRSWEQVLTFYGPYDTPGLAFAQAQVFTQGGLVRQAAQYFDRARSQATNDIASRLWLGYLNLNRNQPDRTLEMIQEIRAIGARVPEVRTNLNDLFTLEAAAYLAKKDDATAHEVINTNLARDPKNFNLIAAACKAYADNGRYTNALEMTERLLEIEPTNVASLINKGCFLIEIPDFDRAIGAFNQAIAVETNNYRAILYRAIAQLRANRLDEAAKDYETVQRQYPKEFTLDYGLGEIAYRRKDTNTAIRYYESYLANAPVQTPEAKAVAERINELKGIKPPATNAVAPPPK
jgi:tetratricopeptide (TPR) repeat protein